LGAADRIFKILMIQTEKENNNADRKRDNTLNEDDNTDRSCTAEAESQYALEISNLNFSYKDTEIFHDFCLRIKKGETVAIVGPSGSGKTTLARLCCGLFLPDEGDIRIFGRSVRDDPTGARKLTAYVPQVPYLFAGTIRENISYGFPESNKEEEYNTESCQVDMPDENIKTASVMANSHDFISLLKDGYDSSLKEHGSNLSGGQKQRIAIARALAGNAPFIIFDEATSSLDNESEQMIKATMESLSGSRTMLVIAHRLSTVRSADRIIVLINGEIAEEGTHDELLSTGGEYNRLYNEGQISA
jgi:ATP-binding cassette subfamily B protein/subfamily B ATP-binding cassette protein MsbA